AEGSGVQIFFVTPVAFRRIALGKNLAHGTIIALQIALIWLAVAVLHGPPSHAITAVTVAALCFAMPLEFSVGNVLSLWFPKRIDYSRFGRQRASRITVLAGMLVHSLVVGIAALTVFAATMYVGLWAAVPLLLVLTALTVSVYLLVAARLDSVALGRRETIISELSRTEAS
ncbi:MAG TPA: hypothetical protein VND92_00100, partial [Vicinamibacterales bacterium]|nr:hypothetical protein [Vicinamibacterales bacterium]